MKKGPADGRALHPVERAVLFSNYFDRLSTTWQAMQDVADLPERVIVKPQGPQRAERRLGRKGLDELIAGYRSGRSTPELMRQYNLGKGTVLRLLREAGVEMRRHDLPDDKVEEAAALYRTGMSLQRIADRYGVSVNAVYNKLRAAGVRMRDSHGRER